MKVHEGARSNASIYESSSYMVLEFRKLKVRGIENNKCCMPLLNYSKWSLYNFPLHEGT